MRHHDDDAYNIVTHELLSRMNYTQYMCETRSSQQCKCQEQGSYHICAHELCIAKNELYLLLSTYVKLDQVNSVNVKNHADIIVKTHCL